MVDCQNKLYFTKGVCIYFEYKLVNYYINNISFVLRLLLDLN